MIDWLSESTEQVCRAKPAKGGLTPTSDNVSYVRLDTLFFQGFKKRLDRSCLVGTEEMVGEDTSSRTSSTQEVPGFEATKAPFSASRPNVLP